MCIISTGYIYILYNVIINKSTVAKTFTVYERNFTTNSSSSVFRKLPSLVKKVCMVGWLKYFCTFPQANIRRHHSRWIVVFCQRYTVLSESLSKNRKSIWKSNNRTKYCWWIIASISRRGKKNGHFSYITIRQIWETKSNDTSVTIGIIGYSRIL